jgi:hypothetical protein
MVQKTPGLSRKFDKATSTAVDAAKKELIVSAKAHGVSIKPNQMLYMSLQEMIVVHAPLVEIERYKAADFAAGAPILLMIVKSTAKGVIPDGSYVVKAQHQRRATTGTAIFSDRTGTIVARRDLIVRTRGQAAVLFPDVYSDPGPVEIPVITSGHAWGPFKTPYVDCAGWQPHRVLIFSVL